MKSKDVRMRAEHIMDNDNMLCLGINITKMMTYTLLKQALT